MTGAQPKASVILCTRNRSGRLRPCLDRVTESARRARTHWELVVVDNGSVDDTQAALRDWAEGAGLDLTILVEPRVGLSVARNRGVEAARGELLVWMDDDCLVAPDWLESILAAFEVVPRPDLVGGRVDLWDPRDARISIRPFDDRCDIEDLDALCGRLIGCNFAVRAEALQRIGRFDESLGLGTPCCSAEDFDIFYRLLKAGYRLCYEPTVRLSHAHGRRETRAVEALGRQYLRGLGAFYAKHILQGDKALLRRAYWESRGNSRLRAKRDFAAGAMAYFRARSFGRVFATRVN